MTADRKKSWLAVLCASSIISECNKRSKVEEEKGKRITIKRSKWAEEENGLDMALYR
jgi:hypothetical protein